MKRHFDKEAFLQSAKKAGDIIREAEAREAMAEHADIAAKILTGFYLWCKENGIEKGSVKRFAKEYGILIE